MKLIYDPGNLNIHFKPKVVLTLGVFDGVHIGHKYLIKKAVEKAKRLKCKTAVVTFWPHPQSSENILTLSQRIKFISELGVDCCIVVKFGRKFSSYSPEAFIDLLVKNINPSVVIVGEDFKFGKDAKGDVGLLKLYSKKHGFKFSFVKHLVKKRRIVSSTYIRYLIKVGKLDLASEFLGRPFGIGGIVVKGASLAKSLGYPTVNMRYKNHIILRQGVYACMVNLDNKRYKGLGYISKRKNGLNLEVNLFGVDRNIYGKFIEVDFLKFIRPKRNFKIRDNLIKRIKLDELEVRKFLTSQDQKLHKKAHK